MSQLYPVTLVDLKDPNPAGRIYPRDVVINAIRNAHWTSDVYYDEPGFLDGKVDLSTSRKAGSVTNMFLAGDKVVGLLRVEQSPAGHILKGLVESNRGVKFNAFGTGEVNTHRVVSDYNLLGFSLGA